LESETNAIERGATILGYVSGYGNTNDSHHQTASSEVGIGYSLQCAAPKDAGLQPKDISYINAHGTGTINNDLSEGNAVQEVFEKVPPIASTKSYIPHPGCIGLCRSYFFCFITTIQ
jgi:3-oxoacyl-[acyl-carrier-protein] synthase-1